MTDISNLKEIKDLKDFKIFINNKDNGISRTLKKYKFKTKWPREPEFMHLFHSKINSNSNVIDLGANIGYLTLYFKKVLNVKNKILAVEPEARNFQFLTENINLNNLNNEVLTKNVAIAEDEYDKFFDLSDHSNLHKITEKPSSTRVPCQTLSSLVRENNFIPDFIKMDVEGAEIEVIEGFKDYLDTHKGKMSILFEVHPNEYNENRSFNNQLNYLFDQGFVTEYLITAGTNYPEYFRKKNYEPDLFFQSGKFKRFIISNVKNEHVLESLNNQIYHPEINSFKNMIKNFKLYTFTKKIVRGLLLTKNI